MFKKIELVSIALICGFLLFSCVKKAGKKELEDNLKAAMVAHLNHNPQIDTSRVKFYIQEVIFFEEKEDYLCEFKVNMKEKLNTQLKDTTGTMSAKISKDFKIVTRRF